MKTICYIVQAAMLSLLFSSAAFAHGDGWWGGHGHGWGHHHHHHHGGWGGYGGYGYAPPPPPPQVNYYYPQPPVQYYAPQPRYYAPEPRYGRSYYDNRSHQGLAGGVVGSVFGYELGNGHPLAAGIGAAAGSFLGNGDGWRY